MSDITNMTMSYEYITPEIAELYLSRNKSNRSISKPTVSAYATDIENKNWNECTASSIAIDQEGYLRNGQHRLSAIVQTGVPLWMWVCRNVDPNGLYDNNRKRSNSDQVAILRPDFESIYKSTRYGGIARAYVSKMMANAGGLRGRITVNTVLDFTDANKNILDAFFLKMPYRNISKVTIGVVYLSLFLAYLNHVNIYRIINFFDVLCSGMSSSPEEYPIIAYRNYLLNAGRVDITEEEIRRCQYALQKYLNKSCCKQSKVPKDMPYPWINLPIKKQEDK